MTPPRATLVPMGNGVFSGNVDGHPAPGTSLTATRLTHDTMKVRLHQGGGIVGTGLLRLADGRWTGSVDEFAGRWFLEARKGSAEVVFHETADAGGGMTGEPRIIRVFPRRTKATPVDALAYVGPPDLFAEADEVHISVTFTYDKAIAERLAEQWRVVAPVKLGGVAYGDASLEFIPGRYVRPGYTITSRGCPRRCWFCGVWKKWPEPNVLPIYPGWNVLDDNLLACPRPHVEAVFAMLRQQERRVEFTGGLEALSLQDYQVGLLADLKPRPNMFWAYDPGDEFETLRSAASRMLAAGFTRESHRLRVYVLVGYPKDTFGAAEARLQQMLSIGLTPMAMLWNPETPSQEKYRPAPEWRAFQRRWARPAIIHAAPEQPDEQLAFARAA